MAEVEAAEYASSDNVEYLNACTAYHLVEIGFGAEGKEVVVSEMRQSDLKPSQYLDRFFFTGEERVQE